MIAGMILAPFFAKKMKNRNIAIMFFGFALLVCLVCTLVPRSCPFR